MDAKRFSWKVWLSWSYHNYNEISRRWSMHWWFYKSLMAKYFRPFKSWRFSCIPIQPHTTIILSYLRHIERSILPLRVRSIFWSSRASDPFITYELGTRMWVNSEQKYFQDWKGQKRSKHVNLMPQKVVHHCRTWSLGNQILILTYSVS